MPINTSLFPALSCSSFIVSGLILRSFIHFELYIQVCIGWQTWISFQFSACRYPVFTGTSVEEAVFFSLYVFGTFVKKSTERSCVDSYLHLLFCSNSYHICFCASTMLFLLLWLCSIG
jgi:hypothetical protein